MSEDLPVDPLPLPEPKFSVVMPLYNKAAYVETAIRSVLGQTCAELELIVVDDGSTDDGPARVRAIADPRLRLVSQRNAGVSVARNRGIESARGEWVTLLDADDAYHPQFLQWVLFARQQHPSVDVIGSQYIRVPNLPDAWPPVWSRSDAAPPLELITDLPARWMQGSALNASSVAVRTARLQSMQPCFPPGESFGEDLDLWFRLGECSDVLLIRRALAAYRSEVAESLSAQATGFHFPPFIQRLEQRVRAGQTTPARRDSSLRMIGQFKVTGAREALAFGRRTQAARFLAGAGRAIPTLRWCATLLMLLFVPAALARRWQAWRMHRHAPRLDTTQTGG
jgi:Glycosyl transferase family 2